MPDEHETSGLRGYIRHKRRSMLEAARERPRFEEWREEINATVVADDASGVRKMTIREWTIVGDSGPSFGGQGTGPSSPELLCGVIGTCLAHTYEIAAAMLDVPIDRVEIRVSAQNNDAPLLGLPSEDPDLPWGITARVRLEAEGVPAEQANALHAFVRERCPLTRLIRTPNELAIMVDG
jgi:uncharacterized OsmC-like protein